MLCVSIGMSDRRSAPPLDSGLTWFDDIDHVSEVNSEGGWSLNSFQLEAGRLVYGARLQPLGEGTAFYERVDRQVGVVGEPPPHGLAVTMPLRNLLYVNGVRVEPGEVFVASPGSDIRMHTGAVDGAEHPEVLDLHLDGASIAQAWRALGEEPHPGRAATRTLRDTSGRIQRLGLRATYPSPGADPDGFAALLAEELAHLWTAATDRSSGHVLPRRSVVAKLWSEGLRNLDGAVPLEQLCRTLGVSPRTLRRACADEFGMGPNAVLRLQRLHHAKRMLDRERDRPVGDVARACGFQHFGRFSVLFKDYFGRSPSTAR